MNLKMMPRIQGKVGQIEDPPELKGQWAFTIWVSFIGDGEEPREVMSDGPFPNEHAAKSALRKMVDELVRKMQESVGSKITGDFIDLKSNRMRNIMDEA